MTKGQVEKLAVYGAKLIELLRRPLAFDPCQRGCSRARGWLALAYGAEGLGEMTTLPTAPAVLNAIYDAVGVRFERLPVMAEKVLMEMKRRG